MNRFPMVHLALVCTALWLAAGPAQAHDPGLSSAALRIAADQLTAHLSFARREIEPFVVIDADQDGSVSPAEWAAARPALLALQPEIIDLHSGQQQVVAQSVTVDLDQSDALHFRLDFPTPGTSPLTVHTPIMPHLTRGHRQYVSVRDSQGMLLTEHVLDAKHAAFTLPLAASHAPQRATWQQFLLLGIDHILTGYDHLLFLFALLIVGGNFWQAWRIITAFTVAHSLTLALATLQLVHLPALIVEPLIAASIVYVGLENLLRHDLHRRWLLTFAFGLLHGLGFASVLQELGIGTQTATTIALPLLSFNLGVELGQVAITLLLLPLIYRSQRHPHLFPRLVTVCSVLVMGIGTYWVLARTVWS